LELYEKALKLHRETLGKDHPKTIASLNKVAQLYLKMGKPDKALPLTDEAVQSITEQLNLNAAVQSVRQQLAAKESMQHVLGLRLSLGGDAYPQVIAWKGAVLHRQRQRAVLAGKERKIAALNLRLRETLERLQDEKARRDEVRKLTIEQERLETQLSQLVAE